MVKKFLIKAIDYTGDYSLETICTNPITMDNFREEYERISELFINSITETNEITKDSITKVFDEPTLILELIQKRKVHRKGYLFDKDETVQRVIFSLELIEINEIFCKDIKAMHTQTNQEEIDQHIQDIQDIQETDTLMFLNEFYVKDKLCSTFVSLLELTKQYIQWYNDIYNKNLDIGQNTIQNIDFIFKHPVLCSILSIKGANNSDVYIAGYRGIGECIVCKCKTCRCVNCKCKCEIKTGKKSKSICNCNCKSECKCENCECIFTSDDNVCNCNTCGYMPQCSCSCSNTSCACPGEKI